MLEKHLNFLEVFPAWSVEVPRLLTLHVGFPSVFLLLVLGVDVVVQCLSRV